MTSAPRRLPRLGSGGHQHEHAPQQPGVEGPRDTTAATAKRPMMPGRRVVLQPGWPTGRGARDRLARAPGGQAVHGRVKTPAGVGGRPTQQVTSEGSHDTKRAHRPDSTMEAQGQRRSVPAACREGTRGHRRGSRRRSGTEGEHSLHKACRTGPRLRVGSPRPWPGEDGNRGRHDGGHITRQEPGRKLEVCVRRAIGCPRACQHAGGIHRRPGACASTHTARAAAVSSHGAARSPRAGGGAGSDLGHC